MTIEKIKSGKTLGANAYDKVTAKKVNEIIETVNDITDGTYDITDLTVDTLDASTSVSTNLIYEHTAANGVTVDGVLLKDGKISPLNLTVTQLTSITTGVTIDAPAGVITTVSSTLAAEGAATFAVSNSFCRSSSVILANILDYSATASTNGLPSVIIDGCTDGAFNVTLMNNHGTNALSGTLKISFCIL